MSTGLRIDCAAATHEGCVRQVNEDRWCARTEDGLWAVADGMGGHAHGDWAAHAVVQALASASVPDTVELAVQATADAVHSANRRIWSESQRRGQQMGSTVVALTIRGDRFAVMWVGDSRAYLQRGGIITPLTRDHSQVQEMVDRGLLTPEEALHHPRRNVLARAIGVGARLSVDVVTDLVEPGDVFLLCSDGLTGVVGDEELAMMLPGANQAAADVLIARALDRGAPDNVTVVTVGVQEVTRLDFAAHPA